MMHCGPKQKFSGGLIEAAVAEGWMTLSKGKIILHCKPKDVHYKIERMPGRYCCWNGEKLPDDATGELARAHVRKHHAGEKSPDPENPSGYCMINAYTCVRED